MMALHHDIAERLRNIAGLVGRHSPNAPKIEVNGVHVSAGIEQTVAESTLNTTADRLHAGKVSIAVLGDVCRGKTTVLNALLGQELLPSGRQANTGGICKIEFGNNSDSVTLVMDDDTHTVPHEEFKEVINLPQGVSITDEPELPDDLEELRYARLECDSPLLERGVTLVDTLGFNAVNGKVQEETTRRFMREASAVILVLNTAPLVTQTDKNLLNDCYYTSSKGIENVFIVINEKEKGVTEAVREELKVEALAELGVFYADDKGNVDSARFKERVFFVDPLAASNTGIPELEESLLKYVEEGSAMEVEVESAVGRVLLPTLRQVDNSIQEQLTGYTLSQEEFAVRERDAKSKLRALNDEATDVHEHIIREGRSIANRVTNHFTGFFSQRFADKNSAWLGDWAEVAPEVRKAFGLTGILGIPKAISLVFSKKRRQRASEQLQGTLQHLLKRQIDAWADSASKYVQPQVNGLIERLKSRATDFDLQLDSLGKFLSKRAEQGVDTAVTGPVDTRTHVVRGSAVLAGLIFLDPNQVIGGLTNPSIVAIITRRVVDIITLSVAGILMTMFAGPVGWIFAALLILLEFVGMHWFDGLWASKRMGKFVGKKVLKSLSADEVKADLRMKIETQMEKLADEVRTAMRYEVGSLEDGLTRVAEVRAADRSTEEIPRLQTISTLLEEEFEEISRLVFGRVLTLEERKELEKSASGFWAGENADENAV